MIKNLWDDADEIHEEPIAICPICSAVIYDSSTKMLVGDEYFCSAECAEIQMAALASEEQ